MKPLLESAALTDEDYEIWYNIDVRWSAQRPPCLRSHWADRRDAALMLFQLKLRDKLKPRGNYIRWMDLHPAADWRADCL